MGKITISENGQPQVTRRRGGKSEITSWHPFASSMAFLKSAVASVAALADLARLRTAMSWLWKYAPLAAVQYSQLIWADS